MDWIIIPANVLIIFGTIYKLFELFVRKDERKMIINKIDDIKGIDLSGTNLNMGSGRGNRFLPLRIGMLVLGVGLGCGASIFSIMIAIPRLDTGISAFYVREMLSGACICFFGGLALVVSYIIEHWTTHNENNGDGNDSRQQ